MENTWVKIDDFLPRAYLEVLVAINAVNEKMVTIAYLDGFGKWVILQGGGTAVNFITHWRSKPTLPY